MDQITLGLDPLPKKTREQVFLHQMNPVAAWAALVALIQRHARGAHHALGGRPPSPPAPCCASAAFSLGELSDPTMAEVLRKRPLDRRFFGPDAAARMPAETTIVRFRLELDLPRFHGRFLA